MELTGTLPTTQTEFAKPLDIKSAFKSFELKTNLSTFPNVLDSGLISTIAENITPVIGYISLFQFSAWRARITFGFDKEWFICIGRKSMPAIFATSFKWKTSLKNPLLSLKVSLSMTYKPGIEVLLILPFI